jgi:hypothetical protein
MRGKLNKTANEEHNDSYSSPDITMMAKMRVARCLGHVAGIREIKNVDKILMEDVWQQLHIQDETGSPTAKKSYQENSYCSVLYHSFSIHGKQLFFNEWFSDIVYTTHLFSQRNELFEMKVHKHLD